MRVNRLEICLHLIKSLEQFHLATTKHLPTLSTCPIAEGINCRTAKFLGHSKYLAPTFLAHPDLVSQRALMQH